MGFICIDVKRRMGGGLDRGHILYDQQETGLSLWLNIQWNEAEMVSSLWQVHASTMVKSMTQCRRVGMLYLFGALFFFFLAK